MRVRGMPTVARTSRTTVNAMIIPRNQRDVAIHAVFWSGQSILTPGGPSAMSRAKSISSPVAAPARPAPSGGSGPPPPQSRARWSGNA